VLKSKDYFMSDVLLPNQVAIGCVLLQNLQDLPLSVVYICINKNEISITFWGNTTAPWKGDSLVNIEMFRLPNATEAFQRKADYHRKLRAKRKIRLPEGVPFETNTLAVTASAATWRHEDIPKHCRGIVHLYTTERYAVLIDSFSKSGTILDHPLLKPMSENLLLQEDQWIVEFPEAQPVSRVFRIQEATPEPEVINEINAAQTRARESLGLAGECNSATIVERLSTEVNELRSQSRLSASQKKQIAIDLGCLWGNALRDAKQWEWCVVSTEPDTSVYAICHPSRSHAVDPIGFVHRILSSKRNANTTALLFNMIVADDLPEAPPLTYSWLS